MKLKVARLTAIIVAVVAASPSILSKKFKEFTKSIIQIIVIKRFRLLSKLIPSNISIFKYKFSM